MAGATKVSGLTQVAISVTDVPRAVAFYRDAVGLTQLPIPAQDTLAFLTMGSIRLMISKEEGNLKPGGGTVLYFTVENIQDAAKEMAARGVEFPTGPHLIARLPDREIWLAEFKDPDGNYLALMSEVKK